MLHLKPDGGVDLEHRATFFLRGSQQRFLATTHDRLLSIVHPGSQSVQLIQLPEKIRAVCPHPTLECFAWIDATTGSLRIHDFGETGTQITKHLPGSESWPLQGWEDCHFDSTGDYLWLVANRDSEHCEIQLVESRSGDIVGKTIIDDPFSGSYCSFHVGNYAGMIALWLGAGQDGQQIYWLQQTESGISCTLVQHLANTTPPVFSPSGRSFQVFLTERLEIVRFDFDSMVKFAEATLDDDDDMFSESFAWLDDRWALAGTNEGRVYAVDTEGMKIEQEVAIAGHEPRLVGDYFPELAKETGVATDISHFGQLGDLIVFVYRRDKESGLENWKDSLLWFRARWPV
ncbi:hypothetical protein [Anatilimnocola floriformis]|uniref:hypothetical protein n=1 Tax=Anatilimnocola floriformis TaxID=2948575 RepID=UPI0020C2BC48|nr:hypothetical protein [Anatilimnocola floriformis]